MPKPAKRRVAIYARVSTQDQDPQMQLGELRSYAKHRAFTIAHEFIDHVSGTTIGLPRAILSAQKQVHGRSTLPIAFQYLWRNF